MSTPNASAESPLPSPETRSLTLDVGVRVFCRSLSLAGGPGTIERRDDRLVWVRLDSGPTRAFLPAALSVLP